jgi:hypothetical protein
VLIRPAAALLAGIVMLGGCTLIDQRTFRRTSAPDPATAAARPLPALPLIVIRFDHPDDDYGPALTTAVQDAQVRNPAADFDVLTPIPTKASPDVQKQFIAQGSEDASVIGRALQAIGVDADRVHLGFRGDDGSPPREVRVYAR